jgi:uncharacterized membrane protein YebE (DUF533 family)
MQTDPFYQYPNHWTDNEYRALMSLLISVARADGLQEKELEVIQLAAQALQWTDDELKEALKNTTETVPTILLKDGVYVLRDLYLLAMADEKVQDNERALINKYAAQLNLSEEQQACVEKAVVHRLMADSFWSNVLTDNCKLNP